MSAAGGPGVLRATFLFLPGIGPATEAELWRHGVTDWSQFVSAPALPGIAPVRQARLAREVAAAETAFSGGTAAWFARRLPTSEHWRLYPAFRSRTAFLDIETTGLSPYEGIVTVVTVHTPGRTRSFVADDDLEELPGYLGRFDLLVTFNGILFDVPFLEHRFPQLVAPAAHIDLRFVLKRLGHAGGLKRIEERLRLGDRSGVEGVDGLEAVRLWHRHRRGEAGALDRLVRYNRADTVNLEPLLDFAVAELAGRLLPTPGRPLAADPAT
ncbi:MAG TPA: ribonuclease H-like domain-containing protein [Thermoplasmata archaeon]|nr:ribonuclease H-like domain-containing protein [Thermoplasmata archaeon]HUJ78100.1 ribonuclease H-like domain-containing protein [Thermoplasmata archaeon]